MLNFLLNLDIYQWIVFLFSMIMIAKAWSNFLRREKSFKEFISWHIVFGGIALLALVPSVAEYIARLTGFKSGVNAIIFICLIALFYLVLRLTSAVNELQKKLTLLVRRLATGEGSQSKDVEE